MERLALLAAILLILVMSSAAAAERLVSRAHAIDGDTVAVASGQPGSGGARSPALLAARGVRPKILHEHADTRDQARLPIAMREQQAMANMRPFGLLAGADPFRELRRLQDEMDRLVGAFAPSAGLAAAAGGGFPAVNVYAGRDGIAVVAELPGVAKEDLDIQAHRDTLTITGTRRPAAGQEGVYHRRERRGGAFTRSIQLPYRVDPDRIEAQLENGVLRLSLPRPEEDKPRRIAIGG